MSFNSTLPVPSVVTFCFVRSGIFFDILVLIFGLRKNNQVVRETNSWRRLKECDVVTFQRECLDAVVMEVVRPKRRNIEYPEPHPIANKSSVTPCHLPSLHNPDGQSCAFAPGGGLHRID